MTAPVFEATVARIATQIRAHGLRFEMIWRRAGFDYSCLASLISCGASLECRTDRTWAGAQICTDSALCHKP
eukprot:184425-Amphidinium_carterae.3